MHAIFDNDVSASISFHILRDHTDHGDSVVRDTIEGDGVEGTRCVHEDLRESSLLTFLVHLLGDDDHSPSLQHYDDPEYGPEPRF